MENNKTIDSNTRSSCTYGEQYIHSAHNLFNIHSYNTTTVEWKSWDKVLGYAYGTLSSQSTGHIHLRRQVILIRRTLAYEPQK